MHLSICCSFSYENCAIRMWYEKVVCPIERVEHKTVWQTFKIYGNLSLSLSLRRACSIYFLYSIKLSLSASVYASLTLTKLLFDSTSINTVIAFELNGTRSFAYPCKLNSFSLYRSHSHSHSVRPSSIQILLIIILIFII